MNWLLVIVLLVLAIFTFKGFKTGLIMTVFSIGSIVVTLILASILTPIIGSAIRGNEKIYSSINQKVVEVLNLDEINAQGDAAQEKAIDQLKLPESIKSLLKENNSVEVFADRQIDNFTDYISDSVTRIIINAIVYICIYLVIRIIVFFVSKALNIISKLPVIDKFNTAGGTIFGLIQGLLIVWLLFVIVTMMAGNSFGQAAMVCIENNGILEFLFDNNLLLKVITGFIG